MFFNASNEKIYLKDIEYITILDHENINYESATTNYYKIRFHESSYKLYETGNISPDEFTRTKYKRELKKYTKKRNRIERKLYETNDTILQDNLSKSQTEIWDDFDKKRNKEYKKYIATKKPKYIKEISKDQILKLIEVVNSNPITFNDFMDSKRLEKDAEMDPIDLLMLNNRFEFVDNFSYHPTIDFQIITKTDTTIYYTNSQHNPPMPWKLWTRENEIITYDDRINKVLFEILPEGTKLNRERLNESVDSLLVKFKNELKQ